MSSFCAFNAVVFALCVFIPPDGPSFVSRSAGQQIEAVVAAVFTGAAVYCYGKAAEEIKLRSLGVPTTQGEK
jgi:hypothetical protein